jgi:amidase
LTPLDLGSDLGGSIRVPAAFCGLWGHKPSSGIVQNTGHFPGSDWPNPALPMAVQGPHARFPADLELALDVIAGPDAATETGWRLTLPPPRHSSLKDFRVAILPGQQWLPVDREISLALNSVSDRLRKLGAHVVELWPAGLGESRDYYRLFRSLMAVNVSIGWNNVLREKVAADKLARNEEFHAADARGIRATAPELVTWLGQREINRAAWRDFFKDWDVLVTPMTLTPAFEHTRVPNADRRLNVDGQDVEFEYMSFFPSLATLTGQPGTALPAGHNSAGLPIGLQAIGPFLEDRTTLEFARLLERELGTFQPPPGYDGSLA